MAAYVGHTLQTSAQLREILVSIRKQRRLSQAALAERLGITQQSYAQMEANPTAASFERLYRVLRLLDVEVKLTYTVSPSAAPPVPRPPTAPQGVAEPRQEYRAGPMPTADDGAPAKIAPPAIDEKDRW